nr:hypothetical protein [Prevotella sp.]
MEEILADMDKVTRRKERLRQYYLAHREKLLAASKLYNPQIRNLLGFVGFCL